MANVMGEDAVNQAVQLLASLLEIVLKIEAHAHERAMATLRNGEKPLSHKIGAAAAAGAVLAGKGAVKGAAAITSAVKSKIKGGELNIKDYLKSVKKGQQYDNIAVPVSALPEIKKYASKLGVDFYYLSTDNNLASLAVPREKTSQMQEVLKLATASRIKSNPDAVKFVESNLGAEEKELLTDICLSRDIPHTSFTTPEGATRAAVPAEYEAEYNDAVKEAQETYKKMCDVEITDFRYAFPWDDISTMAIEVEPPYAESLAEKLPDDISIIKDGDKLYAYGNKNLTDKVEQVIAERKAADNGGEAKKVTAKDLESRGITVSSTEAVEKARQVLFAQKLSASGCKLTEQGEADGGEKYGILDKNKHEYTVIDKNASRNQVEDLLKSMGYRSAERAFIISKLAKQYDKQGNLKQSTADVQQLKTDNPDLTGIKTADIGKDGIAIFNPKQQDGELSIKYCVADSSTTPAELEASIRKELGITDKIAVAELIGSVAERIRPMKLLDKISIENDTFEVCQVTSQCISIKQGGKCAVMAKDGIDADKISRVFGVAVETGDRIKTSIEKSFEVKKRGQKNGHTSLNALKNKAEKVFKKNKETTVDEKGQTKKEKTSERAEAK